MKFMRNIFVTICLLILFIPGLVNAKEKEKINVYIFYGDGCPHCHNAFNFFDSIEEEYGKYYKLVKYETWYSHRNNKLMISTAEALGTDTTNLGVPYIIIGDKTFLGYSSQYDEDIKKAIVDAYNDENYDDKVAPVVTTMFKDLKNTLITAGVGCLAIVIVVIINFSLRKKYSK